MPKKARVKWFVKKSSLNEIYQPTGIMFSFANLSKSKEYDIIQCHEWVKCRDYLQDVVRTTLTGDPSVIYGFKFHKEVNPAVSLAKIRLLVTKGSLKSDEQLATFKNSMKASLVLVQHFEKYAGVSLSTMKEVDVKGSDKKAAFMFTGSSIWMKSPYLVSMYSYLIRLGSKDIKFKNAVELRKEFEKMVEDYKFNRKYKSDNDVNYLCTMWKHLHTIMKNRRTLFVRQNGFDASFYKDTSIRDFHNFGGILSLIQGATPYPTLNTRVKTLLAK